MSPTDPLADARLYKHEAMRTEFTFRFRGLSAESAPGIARLCIELLDTLESQLSRFIDGSDISRINQMRVGETLYLSEAVEHLKSGGNQPAPEIAGSLTIHPDVPAVTCNEPGRVLDLGGIGKGFALDRLKLLLTEWEVGDALLAAGASSLLAIGPGEWPVDLTGDSGAHRIKLCNQALSASGTGIQGSHIVHPYGDEAMPSEPCKRVWVTAPSAALAEVWSTALMLVPADEIPALVAAEPEITGIHADVGGKILTIR